MPRKLISLLIIATILVSGFILTGKYNSGERFVFYGDVMGYYVYLPSAFIYDNLQDMAQLPADAGIPEGVLHYTSWSKQFGIEAGLPYWLNQYTYAVALMETPFFLAAHLYEKMAGLPANGYGSSYAAGILASSIVYSLLGLLLVYRILRRYFNHLHAFLATVLVLMGTNMLWFTFAQAGMSHIPLFFLYALLMYLTVRLYEQPSTWHFIATGITAGLITIMRPSDILCLLIPLLYGVYNKTTLRQRWQFIRQHYGRITLAALCFLLPAIPQILYWKLVTGQFFYDSYLGQSFNWTDPKIIEGLFSTGNGWLPYAPVMIFALAGLPLRNNVRQWRLPVFVILPLFIYVIYSWFCYNYINGLGSRPMLHMYPLLGLPLAAFIQFISRKGIAVKILFAAACLVGVGMVYSLSLLQAQRKYESDYAKPEFYLQMLFKNQLTYEDMLVADIGQFQPDTGKLKKITTLAVND
ncbi:MAG TPA: glycosyltransferase family 39 protein, partial [Flavipsychrobacter sp.]